MLIQKVHVEWHNYNVSNSKRRSDVLTQIAAFLSIIASLLGILCH